MRLSFFLGHLVYHSKATTKKVILSVWTMYDCRNNSFMANMSRGPEKLENPGKHIDVKKV